MTDMSGLRLWPLALMGWLAAYPPVTKDAPSEPPGLEEAEAERAEALRAGSRPSAGGATPGTRTAWLGTSRALYAGLSDEERARLRAERRAARQAGLPQA